MSYADADVLFVVALREPCYEASSQNARHLTGEVDVFSLDTCERYATDVRAVLEFLPICHIAKGL